MVIAQQNFRDEELLHTKNVLEKKGASVLVASEKKAAAKGMLGATVQPDLTIAEALSNDYDAVIIVGGAGSPRYIWGNREIIELVQKQHGAGKPVAAICLAPVVLAQAGILEGTEATLYQSPDSVAQFKKHGVKLSNRDVVTSGKIVTGNGPAAAAKFGEAVAALL